MKASDFGKDLPPRPDEGSADVDNIRVTVLLNTLEVFEKHSKTRYIHNLAMSNLKRWREETTSKDDDNVGREDICKVEIISGDWGKVTLDFTQKYGTIFAVLNMANAYEPGGGYNYGCAAQEENMFRRTDCHFSIDRMDENMVIKKVGGGITYTPVMSSLLNGNDGRVYLDTASPRVCIRGPEDLKREDLGYDFLPDDCIFPFMELRAAAVDRRGCCGCKKIKKETNMNIMADMRRRIKAQLDTLICEGIRHVIFSAFGCGAFRNPADEVSLIYREEIEKCASEFNIIIFAIFDAGYGPDNFRLFQGVFEGFNKVDVASSTDTKSVCNQSKLACFKTPPQKEINE